VKEILSERLRALRNERGLSQFQLALELELGSGYISEIEQKRRMVSVEVLVRMAEFFNTTPDFLLGYRDSK